MEALMTKPALRTDTLTVRTAYEKAEIHDLRYILNEHHYLQAGRPAGHVLWQGIYRADSEPGYPELVAVLCWGGAAKSLKERDNHIGWDALLDLTDTRNPKSLRHPFSAMLTLIVYGLICGANDVKAIWHKCGPLDQSQRRAIGLTKRNKKTGLLIMPGYGAINDIVNRVCPVELARALNTWLVTNSEHLPKSLALDGKDLGAKGRLGGIVTLCFHATLLR